jgi:flagellar basal-body rod modification protein FlgD
MTVATTTQAAAQSTAQSTAAAQTKTDLARNKLSDTYDNFLKLLTTQLQNQDPLAPMDSAEFTNQLVLYSQVEQQIGQNEKLEKLLTLQNASQTQASLGFIGLDVEAEGDEVSFTGDPVRIAYDLDAQAAKSKLLITDLKGNVVQEVDARKLAGRGEYEWDGKTKTGATAPDGNYKVKLAAFDATDMAVATSTTVFGRVTGIESDSTGTTLLMGDVRLSLDKVRSARDPAKSAA